MSSKQFLRANIGEMANQSEKTIFWEALELSGDERQSAYLNEACAGNSRLRESVDALLRAHSQPDHMIDAPACKLSDEGVSPPEGREKPREGHEKPREGHEKPREGHEKKSRSMTRVGGSGSVATPPAVGAAGSGATESPTDPASNDVGRQIGSYKIMELIGEGGFGLVYVAYQSNPVRRKVALKILKPGMSSKEVLARFAAERQAVAMMDHPNIAQVFDAGVTDDGRPFFAMELVKGVPITDFCQHQELRLRQRVELMRDVCMATHHAHQKGVIHRDLKPSNVLVTLHDDRPVAKIIDFGVAKAIGENLADQTIYTRFFSMIGTPLYMSPEQASMNALDVDTRSDVFSLGVLMYELLAGKTPFERSRLDSASYDEMRRIIMEEEPPKPSTRLTTIIETQRRTVVDRSLSADRELCLEPIPTDLDWIVMRAIEKDRTRRYESAAALASDLKRFLANEQVEARPPSKFYRFTKFVQRNQVAIATSSLVALALMLGTAVSVNQAFEAIDERIKKEAALEDAIAAREEVESFATRLKDANVAVERARLLEQSEQFSDAYAAYSSAVQGVPNYYLVWMQRAVLLAQFQLFEEAASDYSQALALDAPTGEHQWNGATALFLLAGRDDDFRQLYQRLAASLNGTSSVDRAVVQWQSLRGCLVAPESPEAAERMAKLADNLSRSVEQSQPGFFGGLFGGGPPNPWERGAGGRGQQRPPGGRWGRGGPADQNTIDNAAPPGPPPAGSQLGYEPAIGYDRGQSGDTGRGGPGAGPPGAGPEGGSGGGQPPGFSEFHERGPRGGRAEGPRQPPGVRWFVTAWAHQRAGHVELARENLDRARRDQGWEGISVLEALAALVELDDGQDELALKHLEKSAASIRQQLSRSQIDARKRHVWFDLIEHIYLHQEALAKFTTLAPEKAGNLGISRPLANFQALAREQLGL